MNDMEFTGRVIREAREAKGWTQLQLADELDVDVRTVKRLEEGKTKSSSILFFRCVYVLTLSADICIYAPRDDTGLSMHRIFQELLTLTPEQIDRVYRSARMIRKWHDDHPDIVTWEDYIDYMEEAENTPK